MPDPLSNLDAHHILKLMERGGIKLQDAFAHDGSDNMNDPQTAAMVRLFRLAGRRELVPERLIEANEPSWASWT